MPASMSPAVHYEAAGVTVHHGDCLDVLAALPDASVDAVVTDPPYALPGGFMGKAWDEFDGHKDAGFAYWLAGLIDGEGCFLVKRHSRGTHAPTFAIKMRADERGTLERIQRTLNVGTVGLTPGSGGANDQVVWRVQDKAGCQRLVDLLDKYPLRAKKSLDYAIWRDAVLEWSSRPRGNRWHGAVNDDRMASLKTRLEVVKRYQDVAWSGHPYQDWCRLWAAECLRVLKPGGHLLAFGGSRTWHRLACAVEDAGFEVRDSIAWLYASGFPKSLDVSKAIDKAAGAEREVVGKRWEVNRKPGVKAAGILGEYGPDDGLLTGPATDAARQWSGWGTALKPAFEPIVVARKPLAGTVAGNVLAHGTGALNIDGCRVVAGQDYRDKCASVVGIASNRNGDAYGEWTGERQDSASPLGRWPSNVVLSHAPLLDVDGTVTGDACADGCVPGCPVADLDEQSGTSASSARKPTGRDTRGTPNGETPVTRFADTIERGHADEGGASRFFPTFRYQAKADTAQRPRHGGVAHPTVKPLDLMRWLVRLVTPPAGTVLEPFAGSGTTAEACLLEGFRCIAIEKTPEYLPLIVDRITKHTDPVAHLVHQRDGGATVDLGLFDLLDDGA